MLSKAAYRTQCEQNGHNWVDEVELKMIEVCHQHISEFRNRGVIRTIMKGRDKLNRFPNAVFMTPNEVETIRKSYNYLQLILDQAARSDRIRVRAHYRKRRQNA